MRLRKTLLALAAGLALGLGTTHPASALSLQDLVDNASTSLGNIVIRDVKVKAKSGTDLSQFEVIVLGNSFQIKGPEPVNGKGRSLSLSYRVSAADSHSLVEAALELEAHGAVVGKFSAKSTLYRMDGRRMRKFDALDLFEDSRRSKRHDDGALSSLAELMVKEKLRLSGRAGGETVTHSFMTTPEPTALLLVGSGLTGLALIGRRRVR